MRRDEEREVVGGAGPAEFTETERAPVAIGRQHRAWAGFLQLRCPAASYSIKRLVA